MGRGVVLVVLVVLVAVAVPAPALAMSCGVPPTWEDVVDDAGRLEPDPHGAPVVAAYVHEVVASAVPLPPLTSRRNAPRLLGVWGDRDAEPYVLLPLATRGAWVDVLPESCNRSPRQGDLLVTLVHDRRPLGVDDAYVTREVGAASPDSPSGVGYGIPATSYEEIATVLERELGPPMTAAAPSRGDVWRAHLQVWWPHGVVALVVPTAAMRFRRRRRATPTSVSGQPASSA